MRIAAAIVTYVFHPLLLTTWLVLFLGVYFPVILGINPVVLLKFSLFVFLVTFVFPVLNIALMVRLTGGEKSLAMTTRQSRIGPFLFITLIYCFFVGLFIYKALLGVNFNKLLIIIACLVLTGTIITFFYKISIHSLGMGGLIGIILSLNMISGGALIIPAAAIVLLTGVVMSSRLILNAHTLREVMAGALTGLVVGLGGMLLLFR